MHPSSSSSLAQRSNRNHVMLLYNNEKSRVNAAIEYINEELETGAMCVYASVDAFNYLVSSNIFNLSDRISNYETNIREGNLQIINFRPYFESALHGDILPFIQLRSQLEDALLERRANGRVDRMMVFADAACELSRKWKFTECEALEKWWDDTHKEWLEKDLDITVICPHPSRILKKKAAVDKRSIIGSCHSITIDLDLDFSYLAVRPTKAVRRKSIKVLVADSEPDMQELYKEYFNSIGMNVTVVGNGLNCLEYIRRQIKVFDMIILDTHLSDSPGIEVAKKIHETNPILRIVLTTTHARDQIRDSLALMGIVIEDILQKPFMLTELFSIVRPRKLSN